MLQINQQHIYRLFTIYNLNTFKCTTLFKLKQKMSVICYCRKKTKGVPGTVFFFLLSFFTCCINTFDEMKDCLLDQIVHSYYFSNFQVKICHQRFTNYYPMDSTNTFILPLKHLVTNISTCCFFFQYQNLLVLFVCIQIFFIDDMLK